MDKILKISKNDNVAVALEKLIEGKKVYKINGHFVKSKEEISQGHKISLSDIHQGENITKYGYTIGIATEYIPSGSWVHTHNMKTSLNGKINYRYKPVNNEKITCLDNSYFYGYKRENGNIGIRNEIWILNTVGCINKVTENIAIKAREKFENKINEFKIDSVQFFPHPYGCSQLGGDLKNTQKILANLVKHPNAAGVLVCGLGCENNNISEFKKILGEFNKRRVKFINFQEEDDEIESSLTQIDILLDYASKFSREKIPVNKLKIGLKCGGSDSFSGITANPLLGKVSDSLIACGGTSILSEVPEMFGAEEILMNRAKDKEIFNKIVKLINDFKGYYLSHDQEIYENPSPGNIKGGITTLEEKSLGNIEKGGKSQIIDVKRYGEKIENNSGLFILESPGNDLVSTTALTSAGAHIILFTTGRGTPYGGPIPTIKISTNNFLYQKKKHWIDFNAGEILLNESMESLSKKLFKYLIDVASGNKKTINENKNFKEIAIFKTGVTL